MAGPARFKRSMKCPRLHTFDAWEGNENKLFNLKTPSGALVKASLPQQVNRRYLAFSVFQITCREARRPSLLHICHAASKEAVCIWIADDLDFESVG